MTIRTDVRLITATNRNLEAMIVKNVRELQSVIKHALLESTGPVLVPAFRPESVRGARLNLEPRDPDDDDNANQLLVPGVVRSLVSHHGW